MHPDTPSRSEVRKLIDECIRSDAELDAFCIDFFPDIARRFSRGMERVEKINLLLQNADDLNEVIYGLNKKTAKESTKCGTNNRLLISYVNNTKGRTVLLFIGIAGVFLGIRESAFYRTATIEREKRGPDRSTQDAGISVFTDAKDMAFSQDMKKKDLPYSGSIFHLHKHNPIMNARLVIVGTGCEARTNSVGYFSFAECEQIQTGRLVDPRLNILLPKAKIWCKDILAIKPPGSGVIYIDQTCKDIAMLAAPPAPVPEPGVDDELLGRLIKECHWPQRNRSACMKMFFLINKKDGAYKISAIQSHIERICLFSNHDAGGDRISVENYHDSIKKWLIDHRWIKEAMILTRCLER